MKESNEGMSKATIERLKKIINILNEWAVNFTEAEDNEGRIEAMQALNKLIDSIPLFNQRF